jgi:hypothetical protein
MIMQQALLMLSQLNAPKRRQRVQRRGQMSNVWRWWSIWRRRRIWYSRTVILGGLKLSVAAARAHGRSWRCCGGRRVHHVAVGKIRLR